MNTSVSRALSSYKDVSNTDRQTQDPKELVGLLFNGLTDRIASARAALAKGDRMARGDYISKAQKILFGLIDSLDYEAGGEIAMNLGRLYEYSIRRLTEAHAAEDDAILAEVMDLASGIRDAWNKIPTSKHLSSVQ
jgi:flagellar protein FliS